MGRHWSGVDVGSFFHAEELSFHSLIDVECMPCHLGWELRLELAVGWELGLSSLLVGEERREAGRRLSEKRNGGIRKFAYRMPPGGTPSRVWNLNGGKNCPPGCPTMEGLTTGSGRAGEKTLVQKRYPASKLPVVVLSYIHSSPHTAPETEGKQPTHTPKLQPPLQSKL